MQKEMSPSEIAAAHAILEAGLKQGFSFNIGDDDEGFEFDAPVAESAPVLEALKQLAVSDVLTICLSVFQGETEAGSIFLTFGCGDDIIVDHSSALDVFLKSPA